VLPSVTQCYPVLLGDVFRETTTFLACFHQSDCFALIPKLQYDERLTWSNTVGKLWSYLDCLVFWVGSSVVVTAFMPLFSVSLFKRCSLAVCLIVFGHIGWIFVSFERLRQGGIRLVLQLGLVAWNVGKPSTHFKCAKAILTFFLSRFDDSYSSVRSDNGSELTAIAVREWLEKMKVQTLYITPGSPWENGCNESFNGKLRDEF